MSIRNTHAGLAAEEVWIPGGGRGDGHVLGGVLEIHGGHGIESAADDTVGSDLRPEFESGLDVGCEAVQNGVKLLLALRKAACKLANWFRVVFTVVVSVKCEGYGPKVVNKGSSGRRKGHTSVQSNEIEVFKGNMWI